MSELTLDDLRKILRDCAGEDEGVDLDGDIVDTQFLTLGYDSLAVLEAANQIERAYGVKFSDDILTEVDTPRVLLDLSNKLLRHAV
jgi:act minimal PKS acyl carrier protein